MSFLKLAYNEVFYRPLLNGLLFLTSVLPGRDLGLAVILLTLLSRILTFPLTHSMIKTQSAMKKLEPELKKIYKDKKNKEEQNKAIMELYRAHGVNPLSGLLAVLVQFPLLFALFQVFQHGASFEYQYIYSFVQIPENINTLFLGLIELTSASPVLAALAGVSQYAQMKLASPPKTEDQTKSTGSDMQRMMAYTFPVMIFAIGFSLPAAVALYWTAMNVFAIIHEAIVRRRAAAIAS